MRFLLIIAAAFIFGAGFSPFHDREEIPDLLITEVSPSGKQYEYIEIYNNTSDAVNLGDYALRYLAMDETMRTWDLKERTMVPPGKAAVLWLTKDRPSAEFKKHYKMDVELLATIKGSLKNKGKNTLVLATDTGAVVSYVSYETGNTHFRHSGKKKKLKQLDETAPSPGRVTHEQVPDKWNEKQAGAQLTLAPISLPAEIPERTDLELEVEVKGREQAKRVEMFYKRAQDKTYSRVNFTMKTLETFQGNISRYDIYGAQPNVQYFFELSDGLGTTTRYPAKGFKTIKVGNPAMYKSVKPGLSVQDNTILRGVKKIQVHKRWADEQLNLTLDSMPLPTQKTLGKPAAFVFEGLGIDERKKSAIFVGKQLIASLAPTEGEYQPYEISIPLETLKPGKNRIAIHTGTKREVYRSGKVTDVKEADRFTVKNSKLLLDDGTIIRPKMVKSINAEGDELKKAYRDEHPWALGKKGVLIQVFEFHISADKFKTLQAEIDTSAYEDGIHLIKAEGEAEYEAQTVFDNSPPKLNPVTPEKGKTYKGTFTITANPEDKITSIASVKGYLDGKEIELPYTTSSGKLKKGKHTVRFVATDAAGNRAKKTIPFRIVEETPIISGQISPKKGEKDVSLHPSLSVKVEDPTDDKLLARFYAGHRYDAAGGQMKAYTNIAAEEPPKGLTTEREEPVKRRQLRRISKVDGKYWTTEADSGFPYQRYQVKVAEPGSALKEVELEWVGHSLQGRRVTMYAWNRLQSRWDALVYGYGEDDFTLRSSIEPETYMKDGLVDVLIQDKIVDEVNRPFNLVWMSDTQYYSETFAHVFPVMTNWIRIQNQLGNAEYVIHTGDLVNVRWDKEQWDVADRSMSILDENRIPYGVLSGNHDVGNLVHDYRNYARYFGKRRFHESPFYNGTKQNRNHYDLMSFGGHDFLFLYLGWGHETSRETLKWVDRVLRHYSERNVVLAVHNYLDDEGSRTYNGKQVFNKIVRRYDNIKLVLAGHIPGASRHTAEIPVKERPGHVRKVYEMLADYQSGPEGGQGYMRMLHFDPAHKRLSVKTYSPYLDDHNFFEPEKDEFTIEGLELNPIHKQVATDYIGVNVYTNKAIGRDYAGKKNRKVKAKLRDLTKDTEYFWYVELSDSYGGWTRSPLWNFRTKE